MSADGAARPTRTLTSPLAAFLLLAAHFGLAVSSSRHDSCTFDEVVFIAGGLSHWATGDYRLAPDGGALAQRWAAIPLVLAGTRFPEDDPAWRVSDAWVLGNRILDAPGTDRDHLLLLARSQIAVLSVLLGLLVWTWSRRLFGPAGGLVSLALYAFSPAFLAHGRLVTADASAALLLSAATWACWRAMKRVSAGTLATSCAATALLFLAKMSAVLVLPVALILLAIRLVSRRPLVVALGRERIVTGPVRQIAALLPVLALHGAVTIFAIWGAFAFRYSSFRETGRGDIQRDGGWPAIAGAGWCEAPVTFAREHRLLPEGWLFGFQYVLKHARDRRAYALGNYSMTGWWWYFPLATILKTPAATLAVGVISLATLAAALAAWSRRRTPRASWPPRLPGSAASDPLELSPLVALILVYGATSLAANINLGMRHVLPAIPPMLVMCGAAAWLLPLHRRAAPALAILLVLGAAETLHAFPRYIGYFNVLGGPPGRRWRILVDSSLDWGQGLKELRSNLARRRAAGSAGPTYLAYFGSIRPASEGLDVLSLPGFHDLRETPAGDALRPGLYCISATILVQVYSNFPGTWARPYEDAWQRASQLMIPWLAGNEWTRRALRQERGDEYWTRLIRSHEQLRLARLCAYLRHREPDDAIDGGSILAWQLSQDELDGALDGPPAELAEKPIDFPWAGSDARAGPP